jgi:hypothetical protein
MESARYEHEDQSGDNGQNDRQLNTSERILQTSDRFHKRNLHDTGHKYDSFGSRFTVALDAGCP